MSTDVAPSLLSEVVVHCFWSPRCQHVVRDFDSQSCHDRMEDHYATAHQADIAAVVGVVSPREGTQNADD